MGASNRIIVQLDEHASPARADSLAIGLAALAMVPGSTHAGWALSVLERSASPPHGRPYDRAFERLHDVFVGAPGAGARNAAMAALGEVDATRALAVWKQEATRAVADEVFLAGPVKAIELLCRGGGVAGRSILRQLAQDGLISDGAGAHHLLVILQSDFTVGCGA